MKNLSTLDDEHKLLFSRLPWLANGTLDESEADQLNLHMEGCELCRREMASLARTQNVMTASHKEAAVHAPDVNASLTRMRRRIAEEETTKSFSILDLATIKNTLVRLVEDKLSLRWAVPASCGLALVIILAQQFSSIDQPEMGGYQVLSSDEQFGDLRLFVQLDPDLTSAQQSKLLNEIANLESFDSAWSESENNTFLFSFNDSLGASATTPDAVRKLVISLQDKRGVKDVELSP